MAYCSIDDIKSVISNSDLIDLTNSSGGGTVIESTITDAISFSDAMIDGYLRGRYNLPLSSTPTSLKYIAVDFVVYRLYSLRHFHNVPENIKERYDDVIRRLYEIQKGKYDLGIESTAEKNNLLMTINKTSEETSVNKYYNKSKWDSHSLWEGYE